jgi:hypothetical protein
MNTGSRIQDDPGIANRYLAGQLTAAEQQAYEQYLLENHAAVEELEATARLKVGLASLRESGQLESLRATRAARPWLWTLAVAATAAFLVIGIGVWRGSGVPRDTPLVAAASELMDSSGHPLESGASYALLPMRSSTYDAVIELPREPRAIELRARPDATASAYTVALSRIGPDGSSTPIGTVSELPQLKDDFVRVFVDSSRLQSGPYVLVISPTQEAAIPTSDAFRLKIVAPEGAR